MTLPYPWQRLGRLGRVTVVSHRRGPMGTATFAEGTVSLRDDLTPAERRCTLLHELLHLGNGPQPWGLRAKEEEQVRRHTARVLLPAVDAIADALQWSGSIGEAADELGVDLYVLRTRLRHLTSAEARYLQRRLAEG